MPCEFRVDLPCEQTVAQVYRALRAAGFEVAQSFDLRSAHIPVTDSAYQSHGLTSCDCHYNVLLIYGQGGVPQTLVVHGQGDRCWIVLATDPETCAVTDMTAEIALALVTARLIRLDKLKRGQ